MKLKPNQLTMSALPRTFACPASLVYPHARYVNRFSEEGQKGHSAMESAVLNWELHKLPLKVAALLSEYEREDVYVELTLVYDYVRDTARTVDKVVDRQYVVESPFEIPGTSDVVAVDRKHKRGLVVDYKQWEEVGAPEVNTQTMGYAVALSRVFELDEVTVAIAYLGEGKRNVEDASLDDIDFMKFGVRLRDLNLTVAAAAADPKSFAMVGRHCRWCPAFHDCDEQKQLAADASADNALAKLESRLPFDDDEEAARAYDFSSRLKILSKRLNDALYARASERPIPLSNGKVFGRMMTKGNLELDADTVYSVMRAKFGQPIADAAVERVATQTKIEEALRLAKVPVLSKAKEAVLAEVERLGGSKREPKAKIEETTPDKLVAAQPIDPEVIAAANKLLSEVA